MFWCMIQILENFKRKRKDKEAMQNVEDHFLLGHIEVD